MPGYQAKSQSQIKKILQVIYARIPGKIPVTAAQKLQAVGAFSVPDQHLIACRRWDIIRPVRHGILMQDREVFVESRNNQ